MCKNVIKLAMLRLRGEEKAQFQCRLTRVRAAKRQKLWVAQDGKCHYCSTETVLPKQGSTNRANNVATLDHIITQTEGGTDSLNNMVMACSDCNNKRGDLPYDYFVELVTVPGAWTAYCKKMAQEKAERDEVRRQAGLARHNELVAMEKSQAEARRNERLRRHAIQVIKYLVRLGHQLPDDPEERIQAAIDYHAKQNKIHASFGNDGESLLKDWIHRANFNPRKEGRGWIGLQDAFSMSPYPWKDLTGDTELYIKDILQT